MAHVEVVTEQSLEAFLGGRGLRILEFGAPWCQPCHRLEPALEELARQIEGRGTVGKVDIDQQSGVAELFQVMGIPVVIFFRGGEVVRRLAPGEASPIRVERIALELLHA